MSDLKRKRISVTKTEIKNGEKKDGGKWVMIKLETTDKEKFNFFTTKKDGSFSKAFEFYKANKDKWDTAFMMGGTVDVDVVYNEEEKTFTGDDGKEVKYTARGIVMFEEPEAQPSTPEPAVDTSLPTNDVGTPISEEVPPPSDEDEIDVNSIPF